MPCMHMCVGLQVSEKLLGESRLQAKALNADVERLGREKQAVLDRAEATKVGGSVCVGGGVM